MDLMIGDGGVQPCRPDPEPEGERASVATPARRPLSGRKRKRASATNHQQNGPPRLSLPAHIASDSSGPGRRRRRGRRRGAGHGGRRHAVDGPQKKVFLLWGDRRPGGSQPEQREACLWRLPQRIQCRDRERERERGRDRQRGRSSDYDYDTGTAPESVARATDRALSDDPVCRGRC
jgi:hypothetical protein